MNVNPEFERANLPPFPAWEQGGEFPFPGGVGLSRRVLYIYVWFQTMGKLSQILLPTLLLWSCATPYRPKGILGGYTDKQIAGSLFEVRFEGNQHTSEKKIKTYLLYRCAEVAHEHGYPYFLILSDMSFQQVYIEDPEPIVPFRTTATMSSGVVTTANPDFGHQTESTNTKAVYLIRLLKEKKAEYEQYIVDTEQVLTLLAGEVR